MNGLAGLADLMVGSEPAGVDGSTGAADDAAQHLSQLLGQLDAALDVLGDAAANGDDVVRADQVNQLLRGLDDLDDLGVHVGLAQGEAGLDDLAPRPPWPGRRRAFFITPGRTVAMAGRKRGQMMVAIRWPPNAGRVILRSRDTS